MPDLDYARVVDVDLDHDATIDRLTALLGEQGFGVLTRIDLQATLKKKLDADTEPHTILGACNPPFALQAVQAEEGIGVLLPCNVVVRARAEGGSRVFLTDVHAMFSLVKRDDIQPIADEVARRLGVVADALAG